MSKPNPTLAALSLALALAVGPAFAEEITTSHGIRTLPRAEGLSNEAQLRQAGRLAEDAIAELLQDIATYESKHSSISGDAAALPDKVKAASADYTRDKAAFDQKDKRYRDELTSFEQRQAALDAEIQRQRAAAAAINPAMPLDEYNKSIADVNAWATRISTERTAIEGERSRLLAFHDDVEAERIQLEAGRRQAEDSLKQEQTGMVAQSSATEQEGVQRYKQLAAAADYLRDVRARLGQVTKGDVGPSPLLEQATAKLRTRQLR